MKIDFKELYDKDPDLWVAAFGLHCRMKFRSEIENLKNNKGIPNEIDFDFDNINCTD